MKNLRVDLEQELKKFVYCDTLPPRSEQVEILLKIFDLYLFKSTCTLNLTKQDLYEIKNVAATKLKTGKGSLLEQDRAQYLIEACLETLDTHGALNKTVKLKLD